MKVKALKNIRTYDFHHYRMVREDFAEQEELRRQPAALWKELNRK